MLPVPLQHDIQTYPNKDHLEHPDSCSKQAAQGKHNIIEQHWYNTSRVSTEVLCLQTSTSAIIIIITKHRILLHYTDHNNFYYLIV